MSLLFFTILYNIIRNKRFQFDPKKDLNLSKEDFLALKKDLKKYIKSSNFKKLMKLLEKDVDKYFGNFISLKITNNELLVNN